MKFKIPASAFLMVVIISIFLIPRCTKESGNGKALFQEEVLENNILKKERHFDLIDKAKYLELLATLNKMTEPFFVVEPMDSDSLMIKSTNPNNNILKERFERVFFNKKTIEKAKTFENIPVRLVNEASAFGFITEIVRKDTIEYLRLPFDALAGPFIEKESL